MHKKLTLLAGIAFTFPLLGSAAMIVDFNPLITGTGYVNMTAAQTTSLTGNTWTFRDAGNPLGSLVSVTGQNGTWYGGIITTWAATASVYNTLLREEKVSGYLQLRSAPAASGTTAAATESNFKAAFLWNMADYLVGAGSSVELGTGSSISFNFPAYSAAGGLSLANEKRMIVNQGGTYYISQQWTAGASNSTGWDPSATDWAVLNTSDYSYGAFNNLLLDDVRGVGFYAQGAAVGGSGFKIGSFEVTAVPEPSTYALIAGFLALGLILVRRRRNN